MSDPCDDGTENETTERRYEQCPSCKQQFKRVTAHWRQGDCDYPQIPSDVFDVCRGLLLAGSQFVERRNDPVIRTSRSSKELSKWLNECLGWLSNDIYSRDIDTCEVHETRTKKHPELWNLKKLADGTPTDDDVNPISLAVWRSIKGSDYQPSDGHPRYTQLPLGRSSLNLDEVEKILKGQFDYVSGTKSNSNKSQRGKVCYIRVHHDEFEKYVDQSYRYDSWRSLPSAPPQKRQA